MYKLIVIWKNGEKSIYRFPTYEDAEEIRIMLKEKHGEKISFLYIKKHHRGSHRTVSFFCKNNKPGVQTKALVLLKAIRSIILIVSQGKRKFCFSVYKGNEDSYIRFTREMNTVELAREMKTSVRKGNEKSASQDPNHKGNEDHFAREKDNYSLKDIISK